MKRLPAGPLKSCQLWTSALRYCHFGLDSFLHKLSDTDKFIKKKIYFKGIY